MTKHNSFRYYALLVCLLTGFSLSAAAQEADDLQEYLDQLAAEQTAQPVKKAPRKGASVEIPVGLTEVDLSKFTSYQNRTKTVTVKANVKFVNGIISAASTYAGGTCLLKVYGGATVMIGESAGVNAGSTSSTNCLAAVGIYEGSTLYQCGDITAPDGGTGVAIYMDGASDTYVYVSGTTLGTIGNKNGGTVIGLEESFNLQKALDEIAASQDKGTEENPIEIELPNTYDVTEPVSLPNGIYVRLKGGKLTIASSFSSTADFVFKINGDMSSRAALYLKNVTIDCNNKVFHYSFFLNRGILKIEDGVTFQNVNVQTGKDGGAFYMNEGTLHIASGRVKVAGNTIFSGGSVYVSGGVLEGSTVVNTNGTWANGISTGSGPGVTVTGGTLKASGSVFDSSNKTYGGNVTISGGTISGAALFVQSSYYSVRVTGGEINVGQLIQLTGNSSMGVSQIYVGGNVALNVKFNIGIYATSSLSKTWVFDCANTDFKKVSLMAGGLVFDNPSATFEEKQLIVGSSYQLTEADFKKMTFYNVPETLEIYYNAEQHSVNVREKETFDIAALTARVSAFGEEVNTLQAGILELRGVNAQNVTGDYYFMRKATTEYSQQLASANAKLTYIAAIVSQLIDEYNRLVNNYSISNAEEANAFDQKLTALELRLTAAKDEYAAVQEEMNAVRTAYNNLEVNFPDEELAWTIRPAGLTEELQMGYKSNRGFVLTSAGMMQFEQVEGATFRLKDMDDNYLVSTSSNTLTTGSQEEATVWCGISNGDGTYTIYRPEYDIRGVFVANYYLYNAGTTVNSAIGAAPAMQTGWGYIWTITESDLDELQAFLNMLAEEEDTEGGEQGGDLTDTDTLVYVLPDYDPDDPTMPVPTKPYVFPKVPYPIHIVQPGTGCWPIPMPTPGQPRPRDFHPIFIPKGSHVIIDDVTFRDIVGGDHVIYVEGIIEINVTITVIIENWEWFIHVGSGGKVIWNPGGGSGRPRIKNEGTFDFAKGDLGYVENWGTWNHTQGTVTEVVNLKTYQFTGGVVNLLHNYGTCNHDNGEVLTAKNYQGGTYTMRGGYVRNTVAGSTETVFINHGRFYFYGGIIGGYGDRLIYHGPGATLRIDGGHFDFTYVTRYWIEAHNWFYIRGDYDYKPTVPLLLADKVTIRILYKWIYKWNIVFINGRPTPRYPLFWGDGFTLTRGHFDYIDWTLPNYRWRWHLNETENTIEPRDEEVEDEDDLQAYLDWLAAHQDDEAASTEEEPQQLDLGGRTIEITQPVQIPAGVHVVFRNGTFRPGGTWAHDRVFYIPATTTVRYERVVIDFSTTTYYVVNGVPVQRYIFDVYGIVHFGTGCVVRGYYNPTWQFTDDRLPGAVVYLDPAARFYFDGGRFENVIFRVNSVVNIYVTVSIVNNIYIYVPTAWRNEGFRIIQPWNNYWFTLADLHRFVLVGADAWTVDVDANGYAALLDLTHIGDVSNNGIVEFSDMLLLLRMMAGMTPAAVRADLNRDGRITNADQKAMIDIISGNN